MHRVFIAMGRKPCQFGIITTWHRVRHGNGFSCIFDSSLHFSPSNAGHEAPFWDDVSAESGMGPGHRDKCARESAAPFRHPQNSVLPIHGCPFSKKHWLSKPLLQRLAGLLHVASPASMLSFTFLYPPADLLGCSSP